MMMKYLLLIIFSILFVFIVAGCNTLHIRIIPANPKKVKSEILIKKSILRKLVWSDKDILFVKIGNNYKSLKTMNNKFSLLNEKNKFIKYSNLEGKHGKILGKFYQNGLEYLLIKMRDGRNIKYARTNWEITSNIPPPYLCLIDEIAHIKNMIGQTIWLNKTKDFLYPATTTFFSSSKKPFNKFDEVKIIDIYPYYNGGFDIPLWLIIKSKDQRIGFVKYNYTERSNGYFENYYYISNPLPKEWGDDIINNVKNGKIIVGMTEYQVRISWGNPAFINTVFTSEGKSEEWFYNSFNPDLVYIKNGEVKSIKNLLMVK
tara:strand:+ start:27908 stop:28855 length:948 start_codon:yes stop_codon:yes gene_type:complete